MQTNKAPLKLDEEQQRRYDRIAALKPYKRKAAEMRSFVVLDRVHQARLEYEQAKRQQPVKDDSDLDKEDDDIPLSQLSQSSLK
jgi:hypothetical protein